jgi:hypothetical protein
MNAARGHSCNRSGRSSRRDAPAMAQLAIPPQSATVRAEEAMLPKPLRRQK